jgi:hypothetical protein
MSKMGQYTRGVLLMAVSCVCTARAQAHPPEPTVNLGDTSFLDAVGGPGLLLEEIGDGSHSGKTVDGTGQSIAGAPAVNAVSGLTHIAWLSNRRLFAGWYGVEAVAVAAHVNAGSQGEAGGWGNLTLSPFILQWPEKKMGRSRIVQRAVLDFDLPAGEYQRDSAVNISSNAFTVHPYYAITVYPVKKVETSWRVHYLWNGTNDAPPYATGASSTRAGQAIHFNATAGYQLPHGIWIGANGYYLKQVTDPKVNGASLPDSPEQVGAIGPGSVEFRALPVVCECVSRTRGGKQA